MEWVRGVVALVGDDLVHIEVLRGSVAEDWVLGVAVRILAQSVLTQTDPGAKNEKKYCLVKEHSGLICTFTFWLV